MACCLPAVRVSCPRRQSPRGPPRHGPEPLQALCSCARLASEALVVWKRHAPYMMLITCPLARQRHRQHVLDVRAGRADLDHGRDRRGRAEVDRHPLLAQRGVHLRAADQAARPGRPRAPRPPWQRERGRTARLDSWHAVSSTPAPRNARPSVRRTGTSGSRGRPVVEASWPSSDRGLRADRGHADRRAGRAATARSTGCACPGSTPTPASPPCSATSSNGQWRISPTAADGPVARRGEVTRRYEDDTLILETDWQTIERHRAGDRLHAAARRRAAGPGPDRGGRRRARSRWSRCCGCASATARSLPWVRRIDHAIVAIAGPDSVWLRTPGPS